MSGEFTGQMPRVKVAPEDVCIYAPIMCVDNEFHKMPAREQDMGERLALLDEMLDYGQRNAYRYAEVFGKENALTHDQRAFKGFRSIVEDWKARVSLTCQYEDDAP